MENQYVKSFPDLMCDKKVMYVHGFASSAQSGTVSRLREMLPNASVVAEDIPLHPHEGIDMLQKICAREQPDIIIGTSMGGMYTEMLYGYDRIITNPAFQIGETMTKNGLVGKQQFLNPRADGTKEFIVTKALVNEYKEITTHCFSSVTEEEQQRVFGLFGDADPVVNTYDLFCQHYTQAIRFHGEHRITDKIAYRYLLPVIRWIDDRQEGRERPTVFISIDTMKDSYGKPASSMHKAYEFLIERYNVYILAPALTNNPAEMVSEQAWTVEYLSAPAWNNLIFTNRKSLLYGDYIIDRKPCDDFMGTSIEYGSDAFKTWEDIITFFERLGGQ